MVMATFQTEEFFAALGKKLSKEELHTALFDMGMELDTYGAEELVVEITPDRLDLLCAQGLARALKSFLELQEQPPLYFAQASEYVVHVKESVNAVRPHTVAAVVKNLRLSSDQIKTIVDVQEKLHATLGRGRKRAAIGMYPMEKITWPITFAATRPEDIHFQPLASATVMTARDLLTKHEIGKQYAHLLQDELVFPHFTDASGQVLSVPPIVNSEATGRVTQSTTDIFIECSGHEVSLLEQLLTYLVTMFADMGADIYQVTIAYEGGEERSTPQLETKITDLDIQQVSKTIGVRFSEEEIQHHLRKMMHLVREKTGPIWKVVSPAYRFDIWHQIDLIDDVARSYGYNNISMRIPQVHAHGATLPLSDLREQCSTILVGLGFLETYTFGLVGKQEQLTNMRIQEDKVRFMPVANGNETQKMLRISLLPQQLSLLSANKKRPLPQKIFEGDFVVIPDNTKDVRCRNEMHFCALIAATTVTYTEIKQVLDALLRPLGKTCTVQPTTHPSFLRGRVGAVLVDNKIVGVVGEMHPEVITNFGLITPVAAFEINLEHLL